jgi:hypothetical protein
MANGRKPVVQTSLITMETGPWIVPIRFAQHCQFVVVAQKSVITVLMTMVMALLIAQMVRARRILGVRLGRLRQEEWFPGICA